MADEDLNKLKIEKTATKTDISRRKRPFIWAVAAVIIIAAILAATGVLTPKVEVRPPSYPWSIRHRRSPAWTRAGMS